MAHGNSHDCPGQIFKNYGTSWRDHRIGLYSCRLGAFACKQADVDRMEQDFRMTESLSFNRVEIDISALEANFQNIQKTVGSQIKIMTVVKSDAYGHGLIKCSQALYRAGARTFGVAEVWEGVKLRRAGLKGDIVVLLGGSSDSYEDIIRHELTPVVFDVDVITRLSDEAARLKI